MALSIQYLEEKLTKLNTKIEVNKTKLAETTRRAFKNRINREIECLERVVVFTTDKLRKKLDTLQNQVMKNRNHIPMKKHSSSVIVCTYGGQSITGNNLCMIYENGEKVECIKGYDLDFVLDTVFS